MYRGIIVLDQNGSAKVQLPDYFEAINKNFTYQLTSIGMAASGLYIKEEITNNIFEISGGKSGQKISWQVIAERNDAYMQAHPELRNDEPAKTNHQKGKYMFADGYNMPVEKNSIYISSPLQTKTLGIENHIATKPLSLQKTEK